MQILSCASVGIGLLLLGGLWHIPTNPMIACGFAGAFFIHLASRPSRHLILLTLAAGAGFAATSMLMLKSVDMNYATGPLAFAGFGSLFVLSCRAISQRTSAQETAALRDALVLPIFSFVAGVSMEGVNGLFPRTWDVYLYALDGRLGLTPTATVTRWFEHNPWLGGASLTTYGLLLMFPTAMHAWRMWRGKPGAINGMHAFVVAGCIGAVVYQLVPACGPAYGFGKSLPAVSDLSVTLKFVTGARNAFPSMHTTWALLVFLSALDLEIAAAAVALPFLAFTLLATLGSGEHYFVDLVVAFPLAMMADAICCRSRMRRLAVILGVVTFATWILLIRTGAFFSVPPAGLWTLVMLSVVPQFLLDLRIRKQASAPSYNPISDPRDSSSRPAPVQLLDIR